MDNKLIRDKELIKLKDLIENKFNKVSSEEWRVIHINGIETEYYCSNYGRISHKINNEYRILKPIRMPNGYHVTTIYLNNKPFRDYYHRIIGREFIKLPEKYKDKKFEELEINHIKGNQKWNNSIFNLEWMSDSENKIHGYKTNLYDKGEDNHFATHNNEEVEYICQLIEQNIYSIKKIAKLTGNKEGFVYDILYKGSWTHISDKYDFSNYKPKQQKYSDDQLNLMKKLLKEKEKSFKEISDITGIKIKTVYYYNKKINP